MQFLLHSGQGVKVSDTTKYHSSKTARYIKFSNNTFADVHVCLYG